MIKFKELNEPDSCLNKAKSDEILFVLLSRDEAAPATIKFWIEERIRLGKNGPQDPQIIEARFCADAMFKQRLERRK